MGSFGGKSNSLIIYHKEESTFHLKESGYFSNIFRLSKHGVSFGSGLNCILDYGGTLKSQDRRIFGQQKTFPFFILEYSVEEQTHLQIIFS